MAAEGTGRASAPPVEARDPDVLRVLICTDTHIGCHERNPVRKDDSINAFRECLELAKKVSYRRSIWLLTCPAAIPNRGARRREAACAGS